MRTTLSTHRGFRKQKRRQRKRPLSAAVGTLCWVLAAARTTENSESHQNYSGDITMSVVVTLRSGSAATPPCRDKQLSLITTSLGFGGAISVG